jgi:predicted O-methyltransferase YrrM
MIHNVADFVWRLLIKYYSHDKETLARMIATLAATYINPQTYLRAFSIWQECSLHITPVHYDYPIPDTRTLPDNLWANSSKLVGLEMNDDRQLKLLTEIFPKFQQEYDQIPISPTNSHEFYLDNGLFGGTDALALYCMIRHFQPNNIIEVGSGFSSLLSSQAMLKNGHGSLVCIEPNPGEVLKKGFSIPSTLIAKKVEDVEPELFQTLNENDILFIDSTHIVKIGGDVNFLFLQVIPELKPGVIIHVHDIFLPNEYRRDYVIDRLNFWTEQYLLQAFLSFNNEFEILLANSYLESKYKDQMRKTFPKSNWWGGGSIWFRRKI